MCNFPNGKFPKVRPSEALQATMGGQSLRLGWIGDRAPWLEHAGEPSAAAWTDLESCRLGSCHLEKILWENTQHPWIQSGILLSYLEIDRQSSYTYLETVRYSIHAWRQSGILQSYLEIFRQSSYTWKQSGSPLLLGDSPVILGDSQVVQLYLVIFRQSSYIRRQSSYTWRQSGSPVILGDIQVVQLYLEIVQLYLEIVQLYLEIVRQSSYTWK